MEKAILRKILNYMSRNYETFLFSQLRENSLVYLIVWQGFLLVYNEEKLSKHEKYDFEAIWQVLNNAFGNTFTEYSRLQFISIDLRGCSQTTLTSFCLFLTTCPPTLTFSNLVMVDKKLKFLTTYPPPLVNVVCEQPLIVCCLKLVDRGWIGHTDTQIDWF